MIQVRLAVFVPGKGLLETRRGLIYGGRHGPAPMIEDEASDETILLETKTALRALRHHYRTNAIAGEQQLDDATRPRRGVE
jgi:hypothetical protein